MTKTTTAEGEVAENAGLPSVSKSEIEKAKKEGVLEAAKEAAKDAYRYADGTLPGDPEQAPRQFTGMHDIMQFEPLLSLGIDAFTDKIAENPKPGEPPVPEEKVAGLLELERSGKNRTEFVKAMMKRLKVKSPYEVTKAGPGYTNDTTPVSAL